MVTREAGHQQTAARPEPQAPPGSSTAGGGAPAAEDGGAAGALAPVLTALVGRNARVAFRFWDGSALPPGDTVEVVGTIHVHSPDAIRRIVWAPGELGLSRAFVAG
jgi:cyclopropane-fatty-acyl-phospholipid synthase